MLMYHHPLKRAGKYPLSGATTRHLCGGFEQQLAWLKQRACEYLHRSAGSVSIRQGLLPAKPVMTTFDDGASEQLYLWVSPVISVWPSRR